MRILIAAVGRLRGGPEADLTADYLTRATQAGRAIALGPCALSEVEAPVSGDPEREAELLADALDDASAPSEYSPGAGTRFGAFNFEQRVRTATLSSTSASEMLSGTKAPMMSEASPSGVTRR